MRHILSTSIAALVAHIIPCPPALSYGETPKEDKPDVQIGLDDKVAGEEPPDFSFIDKLEGGEPSPSSATAPPAASETKAGTEEPKPGREAEKPPVVDPNEVIEIPPSKPETGEQEMPDPKADAARVTAEKKAAAESEAAKKAEAEKKVEPEKKAEAAPVEVKLPTDEEVDAMQPKPGAPSVVVADFKRLKTEVIKPALAEVKRLKAEVETLKTAPAITDEIKAQLQRAKEDREWREAFELEHDPVLTGEYKTKIDKAEADLYALLGGPTLKMSPEAIEKLKAMGLDSEAGKVARQKILDAVKANIGDDLVLDEVKDAFKARDKILREKTAKIGELRGSQEKLVQAKAEKEKGEYMGWAKVVDENVKLRVADKKEIFFIRNPLDTATQAEKDAAAAHNKRVQEETVPAIREAFLAVFKRDPEKSTKYIIDALALPHVQSELDATKKALDEAKARVAELESDGSRMRRVATPSKLDGAAAVKGVADTMNMTAEEAADAYRREKGLMPK